MCDHKAKSANKHHLEINAAFQPLNVFLQKLSSLWQHHSLYCNYLWVFVMMHDV